MSVSPLIGFGQIWHRRLRPVEHAFRYPGYFLLLPMRSLREHPVAVLRRNRRGWLSFHDSDHGDGSQDSLAWFEKLLQDEGIGAGHAAGCVHVFDAHQPLPALGARIQPTGQRRHQRSRVQRAGG